MWNLAYFQYWYFIQLTSLESFENFWSLLIADIDNNP